MSTSDHMRRLIDLANGNSPSKPEVVKESSGSPLKDFARWGKVSEAWGGEPGSDSVHVYQDKDPLGTGQWFWTRAVNGHIVASGSAHSEDEADRAANLKEGDHEHVARCANCGNTDNDGSDICPDCGQPMEDELGEDLLQTPELDEGGKMSAEFTAGMPPFSAEEQEALAGYKAGGGPAEYVNSFIASLRNGTAYDELDEPVDLSPESRAEVDRFMADMEAGRNGMIPSRREGIEEEAGSAMHLLKPRGGSECGAACDEATCTPEINEVTCPACIEGHDEFTKQFEMSHDGDLDKMYAKHTGVEEADHEAPFELTSEPEMEPKQVADDTVDTVTGPAYWASYLVNGDDSSLTPEEKAHADAWAARLGDWSVVGIADGEDGSDQEARFTWSYDIHSGTDTRGGDVVDYVIHKHEPVGEELLNDDILDEDGAAGLHIDYVFDIDDLPEDIRDECISDCSGQGDVSQAVEYWREKLNFTVNRNKAIQCLAGYGSWSRSELAKSTDEQLADRILWLACCNFNEWDGNEDGESASGSPQFVLEAKA